MNKERIAELRIEALNAKYAGKEFAIPASESMEILNLAMNQLEPRVTPEMWKELGRIEAERTTAPVSLTDEQAWTIITEICGTQLTRVGSRKFQVVEINDMATAGEVARALLAAAPAPIQQEPAKGEPEAHKLARILWNMVEAVEDYDGPEIYREGYQSADGDVFVHRAGHLLVEQQAEIAELTRYVDSFGLQLAELKAAAPPALAGSQVQAAGDAVDAARYRWLRDKARSVDWAWNLDANSYRTACRNNAAQMDLSIDTAMKG